MDHRPVDEEADDDRRRAEQNVVDEADEVAEAIMLAVRREPRGGEKPERRADRDADQRHDEGASQRVGETAFA